eukprot:g8668.t1
MARPVSASGRSAGNNPNSRFGFFCGLRRSVSSPGLLQGSHNPGHSLVDIVDIAEAWKHLGGRDSPVLVGEAVNVRSAEDAVGAVPDGPASKDSVRVACGDGPEGVSCSAHGDTRGRGGLEGGNAYKFSSKTEAGHHQQGMELGQDSTADAALADGDTKRSPSGGVFEPGTDVVARAGCVSKPQLSSRSASVAVPTKPETPLDFRKATVKLKVLAAEASVAVDGHEKAWRNSKERAEHTFNDLRFAAEEDAQRSGDAAAMETRHRLQRIIVEAGLENSRRVEKEAALEEICRVLRQDTSVYEARASASDNMLHRIRALEAAQIPTSNRARSSNATTAMCKSSQPQQSPEFGAAVPVSSQAYQVADGYKVQEDQQEQQHVIAHDESSGIVVFGSFVAGALVGVIICAPAFVVLLFGAGAAAMTRSDSKAGKFSRKVGKWSSDILLAVFRAGREFNQKHRLTDKAKESAQLAAAKVSTEVKKRGIIDNVKAKAQSLWAHVDERTAPSRQAPSQGQAQGPGLVTDGTQLPFDGAADGYGDASLAEGKGLPPKSVEA